MNRTVADINKEALELGLTIRVISEEFVKRKAPLDWECSECEGIFPRTYESFHNGAHTCSLCGKYIKHTRESVAQYVKENTPSLELVSAVYKSNEDLLDFKCTDCGHIFPRAYSVIRNKGAIYCPICGETAPLSIRGVQKLIDSLSLNWKVLSTECTDMQNTLEFLCLDCGGSFNRTPLNIKYNNRTLCPHCKESSKYNIPFIEDYIKQENLPLKVLSTTYTNDKTNLEFKCLLCDTIFPRTLTSLYRNKVHECPNCKTNENYSLNKANAERHKKEWLARPAIVYFVNLFNSETAEDYYKVGITTKTLKERMFKIPYSYTELFIVNTNKYDAVYIESHIHSVWDNYKYIPHKKFGGYTECFSKIDLDYAKEYINEYRSSKTYDCSHNKGS